MQLLQGRIDGPRAGRDFSLIAETVIAALLPRVEAEFAQAHGRVPGGAFAVLGLGKLGSREMNALSDIDLIFVYRTPEAAEASDGAQAGAVSTYFGRLGQRMINALTAPTGEGNLYEVDMRLRPSGNAGPIASSLDAFRRYHETQAWTWERMALTRARVIAGDATLVAEVEAMMRDELTKKRDTKVLLADVAAMRRRVAATHPHPHDWDCKHRRGALVDLEFVAQYLLLKQAPADPDVLVPETAEAYRRLMADGTLDADAGRELAAGLRFWQHLQQVLRVTLGKVESAPVAGDLLDRALARALGPEAGDAAARRGRLDTAAAGALALYDRLVEAPSRQGRNVRDPHQDGECSAMTLAIGDQAPDFTLPTDGKGEVTLSGLRGKKVILYFYPKDDTPGCTTEACGFRDALPDFTGAGATVIGISKDNAAKHDKFKAKHGLTSSPSPADIEGKVVEAYDSWVEKSLYGRKYMGIDRATFLIDGQGVIRGIWHKVKVGGHVEAVLKAAQAL